MNVNADTDRQTTVVTYSMRFENGSPEVEVTFRKVGDSWKVHRMDLDADAFTPAPGGAAATV